MSAHPLPDAREQRRLAEASEQLAELKDLWRIRADLAGSFTTPEKRLAASERIAELLG